MATRLNPRHQEMIRDKIKASQLVNRLENYVLAKHDDKELAAKIMTDGQVRAALGLLKKCVPDLSATEHSGEVNVRHTAELTDEQIMQRLERIGAAAGTADKKARTQLDS